MNIDTLTNLAEKAICCGCRSPIALHDVYHLLALAYHLLNELAYPRARNHRKPHRRPQAVAIICDHCAEPVSIDIAVELRGERLIYHDVRVLEPLDMSEARRKPGETIATVEGRALTVASPYKLELPTAGPTITPALVCEVRRYLGKEGLEYFQTLLLNHGTVSPVFPAAGPGMPPHPVHFREGMQIRNVMRKSQLCDNWTAQDLDRLWPAVVCRAIFDGVAD